MSHNEGRDSRSNTIVIVLAVVIAVIIAVLILFATGVFGSKNVSSGGSSSTNVAASSGTQASVTGTEHVLSKAYADQQGWVFEQEGADIVVGTPEDGGSIITAMSASITGGKGNYGILYQTYLRELGWQDVQQSGNVSGFVDESFGILALRMQLTDELAGSYALWYRTYTPGTGWSAWASDFTETEYDSASQGITAYEIVLRDRKLGSSAATVAAGETQTQAPAQESAQAPAQTSAQESQATQESQTPQADATTPQADTATTSTTFTSGDSELDAMLDEIVQSHTGTGSDALRNAYEYVATLSYTEEEDLPSGTLSSSQSISFAKEMYSNGTGNCYRYASLMSWIARRLGYDADAIAGRVPWQGELGCHGWTEVRENGQSYVIDADFHKFFPSDNYFMVSYDTSPNEYFKQ